MKRERRWWRMRDREKETRRIKGRKSIGEKRMKGLCWEKRKKMKKLTLQC